ncbi:hypothetical protein ACIOZM_14730 [Pseudomonas sp. NPDC087346]|uniref:hypothetical protein n=1 Tax=Pseudomonas sp. NPDC087346 TaxID=3364438 RepID=UPI00380B2112
MNSNLNSPQADAALALLPMFIPGWKTPVLPAGDYHGGIPLSIHSPSTMLYMVIDPLTTLSITLAIGDSVELWVNDQPTSVIKLIRKGDENDRIEMEMPWGWLVNGLNTLFYRVTRPSENFNDSTPILNVLFHSPATDVTVSHPASVGPNQPATFSLTRNYAREYDEVRLTVGTWSIIIPYVHPANPITYTLKDDELRQIGDGIHTVSARVVDQLGNSYVSPTSSIAINTAPVVATVITSMTDSAGVSLPNGGSTFQTGGTLRGTAAPNQQLQILLNGVVSQNVSADSRGDWSYSISGLAVFLHTFIARPTPSGAPDSTPWQINIKLEWEDHYTSLATNSYNGWITYTGARCGSIRQFPMNGQWVTAFFNFTDQGAPTGFAGAVFYRDFLFIPGQYQFTFEGTHVADSPAEQLLDPILCADTSMAQWPGARRAVPKNGVWYLFLNAFTITQRQVARMYISNFQDGSYGNDFGIRNINIVRVNSVGGLMSAPEAEPELPVYTEPLPDLKYP